MVNHTEIGSIGGATTLQRYGSAHFAHLNSLRKTRSGGRPTTEESLIRYRQRCEKRKRARSRNREEGLPDHSDVLSLFI